VVHPTNIIHHPSLCISSLLFNGEGLEQAARSLPGKSHSTEDPGSATGRVPEKSHTYFNRENWHMQDDHLYQASLATSNQRDWKEDNFVESEEENSVSESAMTAMKFRSVMGQREMEILTALFPKTAQTLASVLRNRSQWLEQTR
jgi:hypothetical protein